MTIPPPDMRIGFLVRFSNVLDVGPGSLPGHFGLPTTPDDPAATTAFSESFLMQSCPGGNDNPPFDGQPRCRGCARIRLRLPEGLVARQ